MGQRGDGLVEVELVEDDADELARVHHVAGPSPRRRLGTWWSARPARQRSGVARLAAGIAAMSLVAVVVQQGAVAADEAELAALSGRSVSLEAPLHEAWHLDDVWPIGWLGGDLLVTGGSAEVTQRIDPSTGAVRWSVPFGGWCTPVDDHQRGFFTGIGIPQLDGVRLACQALTGSVGAEGGLSVVMLDTADGSTLPGPHLDGDALGMVPVGGDVVIATVTPDGRVLATRWSPDSGETLWSYTGTEPVIDRTSGYGLSPGPGYLRVEGDPALLLDVATGQVLASEDDATTSEGGYLAATFELTLADGSVVRGSADAALSVERTAADGSALPAYPGWPIAVGVDDGSVPGLAFALSTNGDVVAVDLASGSTRWTIPGQGVVAVRDGVVVLVQSEALSAYEVATRDQLWTVPIPADQSAGQAVTDGRSVGYLAQADPDGSPPDRRLVLRVVDLRTGAPRTQTPLDGPSPDASLSYASVSGWLWGAAPDGTIIYVTGSGRLSGLRP